MPEMDALRIEDEEADVLMKERLDGMKTKVVKVRGLFRFFLSRFLTLPSPNCSSPPSSRTPRKLRCVPARLLLCSFRLADPLPNTPPSCLVARSPPSSPKARLTPLAATASRSPSAISSGSSLDNGRTTKSSITTER